MRYVTVRDVIEYADRMKSNSFAENDKTAWLNEIEYRVQYEIMLLAAEEMRDYVYEDIISCASVTYTGDTIKLPKRLKARMGGVVTISGSINNGSYSVKAVRAGGREIQIDGTLEADTDTSSVQVSFDGGDCELLIPAPWSEIYYDYLLMKMSEHLEESSEQNNRAATFAAAYTRLAIWYASTYSPADGRAGFKGYYITGPQGERGEAFEYSDFTPEQLDKLKPGLEVVFDASGSDVTCNRSFSEITEQAKAGKNIYAVAIAEGESVMLPTVMLESDRCTFSTMYMASQSISELSVTITDTDTVNIAQTEKKLPTGAAGAVDALYLRAPNAKKYKITVTADGQLETTEV